MEFVGILLVAVGAGGLGSLLGLGGGVILIPVLTLGFGVPLKAAIAASAISVVANSVSGARIYLRLRYANVRLALILLAATLAGALAGGLLAVSLPESILRAVFATFLLGIAGVMATRTAPHVGSTVEISAPPDPYHLAGQYSEGPLGETVRYVPVRLRSGLAFSSLGGVTSGLFGIGGGPLLVPMMNMLMRVPLKAAASTSSYMVGLAASVSAFVYYNAGFVNPSVTVPALFGIIVGARAGVLVATRIRPEYLTWIFVAVLVLLSISMYLDAFGVL